MDNIWDGNFSK